MNVKMIFAIFIIAMASLSVYYYNTGGFNVPFEIWASDYPGELRAGNPDYVLFASFASRFVEEPGDLISVTGSFYANFNDEATCYRIGGTKKTSGSWVGSCLLNGDPLNRIDYIIDDQGNRYTPVNIGFNTFYIKNDYNRIPLSMKWYMTTSDPSIPDDPEPPLPPLPEPPIEMPLIPIIAVIGIGAMIVVARKYL